MAGLKAAFFAVYLSQTPNGLNPEGPRWLPGTRRWALFVTTREAIARHPDDCALALTAHRRSRGSCRHRRRAIYLSIENGYSIGTDLTLIKTYYGLGARIFGFTFITNNDLGDSASDVKGPSGAASVRWARAPSRNATASAWSSMRRTPPPRFVSSSRCRQRRSFSRTPA